ncbi:hypothetical protein LXA43DRAFT_976983 [Ganoderma leucocontextum]|nr:hypothetical protein LXA43DRAFT_976983 [Ganoderma leucocontextum]
MPSVQVPLKCSKNLALKNVKGLLYNRCARRPSALYVPTVVHPTRDCLAVPRFPSFENVFGPGIEIHESWVSCEDDSGKEHRFLIAAQYSASFEINRSLQRVLPEVIWRGRLTVMRGGTYLSVVNVSNALHKEMAERAVRKFLAETAPIVADATRNNVPLNIPTQL